MNPPCWICDIGILPYGGIGPASLGPGRPIVICGGCHGRVVDLLAENPARFYRVLAREADVKLLRVARLLAMTPRRRAALASRIGLIERMESESCNASKTNGARSRPSTANTAARAGASRARPGSVSAPARTAAAASRPGQMTGLALRRKMRRIELRRLGASSTG